MQPLWVLECTHHTCVLNNEAKGSEFLSYLNNFVDSFGIISHILCIPISLHTSLTRPWLAAFSLEDCSLQTEQVIPEVSLRPKGIRRISIEASQK
jgi:hypothetical protein